MLPVLATLRLAARRTALQVPRAQRCRMSTPAGPGPSAATEGAAAGTQARPHVTAGPFEQLRRLGVAMFRDPGRYAREIFTLALTTYCLIETYQVVIARVRSPASAEHGGTRVGSPATACEQKYIVELEEQLRTKKDESLVQARLASEEWTSGVAALMGAPQSAHVLQQEIEYVHRCGGVRVPLLGESGAKEWKPKPPARSKRAPSDAQGAAVAPSADATPAAASKGNGAGALFASSHARCRATDPTSLALYLFVHSYGTYAATMF